MIEQAVPPAAMAMASVPLRRVQRQAAAGEAALAAMRMRSAVVAVMSVMMHRDCGFRLKAGRNCAGNGDMV